MPRQRSLRSRRPRVEAGSCSAQSRTRHTGIVSFTKQSRCERLVASLICVVALSATSALAQSYPAKPIELVSSTGAGGGSDLVCRVVADIITKEKLLPQSVYVVNKPGGGGAIGQTYVSARRGDPYIFMLAATNDGPEPRRSSPGG